MHCEEGALPDEAIFDTTRDCLPHWPLCAAQVSGTPALAGGAREEQERPRNTCTSTQVQV